MPRSLSPGECPLCGTEAKVTDYDEKFTRWVECATCGNFAINVEAEQAVTPESKPLLSAYTRRFFRRADPPILITSSSIGEFVRVLPRYTPPEKLDDLLIQLCRMSPSEFGKPTGFDLKKDYPLVIMSGPAEVHSYLAELRNPNRGYVTIHDPPIVTIEGWRRFEEIGQEGKRSNRAFVAMWFHTSTDEVYEKAIEPAIREAGYEPLRIDKHEHVNRIDDEIIAQVKRSRFMVADFTGQRHGVYFEAGMMQGLGRNVFWICPKKDLEQLHFDVRQFNFIDYESTKQAKDRLYYRIMALEGEGPSANPKETSTAGV
ncbi:MAG: hypothetical protein M1404_03670 [Acidobacteria bacterium]|nr:hypothetical protein [Acidobacteriota bacterium]